MGIPLQHTKAHLTKTHQKPFEPVPFALVFMLSVLSKPSLCGQWELLESTSYCDVTITRLQTVFPPWINVDGDVSICFELDKIKWQWAGHIAEPLIHWLIWWSIADGSKNFSSGVYGPKDRVSEGFAQDEVTGLFGEPWGGTPISSNGSSARFSADIKSNTKQQLKKRKVRSSRV